MPDFSSLPARPSLEQLQKQAKELLRQFHAGDPAAKERLRVDNSRPIALADAQFAIAREYGFETWAKLKHQIEALQSPDLERFEKIAQGLATAYMAGDLQAIRELNWASATSFIWDREPVKMQQRLRNWFQSESRAPELALADARQLVARWQGAAT